MTHGVFDVDLIEIFNPIQRNLISHSEQMMCSVGNDNRSPVIDAGGI